MMAQERKVGYQLFFLSYYINLTTKRQLLSTLPSNHRNMLIPSASSSFVVASTTNAARWAAQTATTAATVATSGTTSSSITSTSSLMTMALLTPFSSFSSSSILVTKAVVWMIVSQTPPRGGELFTKTATSTLDIGRVRMRLEGLQMYATISALLTNGCLRLYSSITTPSSTSSSTSTSSLSSTNEKEKEDDEVETNNNKKNKSLSIALDIFYICVVISILFGSYTTIVFGLLSLYSKTALGRGYDLQFLQFWSATTSIRESGFESFLGSLISFELAFVISLYIKFYTDNRRRTLLVSIACLITFISFWRWSTIMKLSVQYLFPLRAESVY